MQWHTLAPGAAVPDADAFDSQALEKTHLLLSAVPPRYRASYFSHIWASGYAAGYYAYLWTQMVDDDAYQAFEEQGGLTRANGDRFRRMVLSRGNTQDPEKLYIEWRGHAPTVDAMMRYKGLRQTSPAK
jgi:peptidyl-dipeptidase Dcp